jgi:hypothetical protein
MKQTVQQQDFLDAFRNYGRADQFSRAGLIALFDYMEEYKAGTGEGLELDVIGLCCDFSEYPTALEAVEEYSNMYEPDEDLDEEEREAAALDWLLDRTTVIEFDGGVIVGAF